MKKLIIVLFIPLLFSGVSPDRTIAQGSQNGWYLTLNLGDGSGVGISATDGAGGEKFDFTDGFLVGGGLGYRFHPNFRVEGLFTHVGNDIDDPCDGTFAICLFPGTPDNGEMTANSFLINFYGDLRFDENQKFYPLAGLGLGVASISAELERGGIHVVDDSATVLAYQFTLGAGWDVNPNWVLTLAFRYFGTLEPGLTNLAGQDINAKYGRPELVFGVNYYFF